MANLRGYFPQPHFQIHPDQEDHFILLFHILKLPFLIHHLLFLGHNPFGVAFVHRSDYILDGFVLIRGNHHRLCD